MRIAINTRFLLPDKLEGFGWFSHEVISRMVKNHPEHEFFFFFDRKFDEKFIYSSNVTPIVINPPARHPFLYYIWFEFGVKKALKKYEIDVFLSPDGYLSLKSNIKQIPVIHDLSFEYYPKDIPFFNRKYVKYFFPKFAKKANHILTVSEFSKQDIIKKYGINSEKITVSHNGIGDFFSPSSSEVKDKIKTKFTEGKDYFLFVSALHPRKNVINLFKAFDLFKQETKGDIKLLMVGEKYWWNKEISTCYENLIHKNDIVFTGHVQSSELNEIYGSGLALTYVSYFEGFGIPLVEAMQCKLPIIAANATSLPEVAGEAAIFVNPFDIEDIKNGMKRIFGSEDLRKELIEKGELRAKNFSWNKTSEIVWEVIENVLKE